MRNGGRGETVSVLHRAATILGAVKDARRPLSIAELAQATGLPTSTVARLAGQLVGHGYLTRSGDRLAIGMRLFTLGARAAAPRRLRALAGPVMRELARLTGERITLAMPDSGDMVSIAIIPGRLAQSPVPVGGRAPTVTTATGKACLAFRRRLSLEVEDEDEIDLEVLASLEPELATVRVTSAAFDDAVTFASVSAVASPVLTPDRRPVAALAVAGPTGAMDPRRMQPLVCAAARSVSRSLAVA